ncbi:hypothetical protein V1281_006297 [Nitrobacteraceae bacterium AZCC 2161]
MNSHDQPGHWIGKCLLRKENNRHLLVASTFVGDIRLPTPALTEWPGVSGAVMGGLCQLQLGRDSSY